MEKFIQTSLE